MTPETPSQTAGPYWHLMEDPALADLLRTPGPNAGAAGERITLTGRITDGAGAPCPDMLVELFQADSDGAYDSAFHGFGRCATDVDGRYRFVTVRPGATTGPGDTLHAPHIALTLFARGLQRHLSTRVYFGGEPLNEADPLLMSMSARLRLTMIADPAGGDTWALDMRLQGEAETVFLDV